MVLKFLTSVISKISLPLMAAKSTFRVRRRHHHIAAPDTTTRTATSSSGTATVAAVHAADAGISGSVGNERGIYKDG